MRSPTFDSESVFHTADALRFNARRLEHLVTLELDLENKSVLEVGGGIGYLTEFFVDRRCLVAFTDGREANVRLVKKAFGDHPRIRTGVLDLDAPPRDVGKRFDIVLCYDVLHLLAEPAAAISFMARTGDMLLLETVVSSGSEESLHAFRCGKLLANESLSGRGCRPTRSWLMSRLRESFGHAYVPRTQPCHEAFALKWTGEGLRRSRAVFIGSATPLDNDLLIEDLPDEQTAAVASV